MTKKYQRTIVDGKLMRASASSILKFDALDDPKGRGTGCERAWAFRYVAKIKEEKSKGQQAGIEGHERLDEYSKTGRMILTETELAGKVWLPRYPDDCRSSIFETGPELDDSRGISIAGIPIAGKLDWLNLTRSYVDTLGNRQATDIPEIIDYKFSGAREPADWAMSPAELSQSLPMAIYGVWVPLYLNQAIERVRLSHITFSTKKRSVFKRTAIAPVDRLRQRIQQYAPVVERMKIAAGCSDPNDLPANLEACKSFGGCFYANEHCIRSASDQMRSLLGPAASERLQPLPGKNQMSILDNLGVPPQKTDPAIAALEEAERTATPAAPPPAPKGAPASNTAIIGYLQRLAALDMGTPQYHAEAAERVAAVNRWKYSPGAGYAGAGQIASVVISSVSELHDLVGNLEARTRPQEDAIMSPQPAALPAMVPPDAPTPTISEAATPVDAAVIMTLPPAVQAPVAAQAAAVAAAAPVAPVEAPSAPAAAEPATRVPTKTGRVAWKESCLAAEKALAAAGTLTVGEVSIPADYSALELKIAAQADQIEDLGLQLYEARSNAPNETADVKAHLTLINELQDKLKAATANVQGIPEAGIELWVDCMPANGPQPMPLRVNMDEMFSELAKAANAPHVLMTDHESFAYGKWEGVLRGILTSQPDSRPLSGRYYIHNVRGSKLAEAYVDALRPYCTGYHRGV